MTHNVTSGVVVLFGGENYVNALEGYCPKVSDLVGKDCKMPSI